MSEGEFQKHLRIYNERQEVERRSFTANLLGEARKDFYLALKHLEHRGVKSPYLESVIEKWFGEEKK